MLTRQEETRDQKEKRNMQQSRGGGTNGIHGTRNQRGWQAEKIAGQDKPETKQCGQRVRKWSCQWQDNKQ